MKLFVAMTLAASVAGCLTTTDFGADRGTEGEPSDHFRAENSSEIRMLQAVLMRQIAACWSPPAGTGVPAVMVSLKLNRDGTLASDPAVQPVNSGDLQNPQFQLAVKSALRAVRACTPLRLPAAQYEIWKEVVVLLRKEA
jgi:hypothetical protein